MFDKLKFHTVLLVAVAATAFPASAQVAAAISGQVKDPSGAAVRDATVTVKSLESGTARVSATDATGTFRFLSLPLGQLQSETRGKRLARLMLPKALSEPFRQFEISFQAWEFYRYR